LERFLLLGVYSRIERDDSRFHFTLREVTTEISGYPELGSVDFDVADVPFRHFHGVIELAVMAALRPRVEVAGTEQVTRARLDVIGFDAPGIGFGVLGIRGSTKPERTRECNSGEDGKSAAYRHSCPRD